MAFFIAGSWKILNKQVEKRKWYRTRRGKSQNQEKKSEKKIMRTDSLYRSKKTARIC